MIRTPVHAPADLLCHGAIRQLAQQGQLFLGPERSVITVSQVSAEVVFQGALPACLNLLIRENLLPDRIRTGLCRCLDQQGRAFQSWRRRSRLSRSRTPSRPHLSASGKSSPLPRSPSLPEFAGAPRRFLHPRQKFSQMPHQVQGKSCRRQRRRIRPSRP